MKYVLAKSRVCYPVGGKVSPSSEALLSTSSASATPPPPSLYLPAHFKMSNAQLAFFLRETAAPDRAPGPGERGHPLQRSESFVVFQTKELPAINITLGPFARDQVLTKELLQPASPLDIPGTLTVNWKVRAFIVQTRVFSSAPTIQVFFYIAGRDWDDFRVQDKLPCVRLHAFRDVREIKTSCRMKGSLAQCLAQLDLPQSWFNTNVAPLGRRKGTAEALLEGVSETLQAELYYTLHEPGPNGGCNEGSGHRGGQHPLLRIGSISLYQAGQETQLMDKQLDKNMFLRLPDKPLRPGETLRISLYLMPNSTVDLFTLRVKAKKGVNLLQTRSLSVQWKVDWEVQSGAKHSISTIQVTDTEGNLELMQLDFEMENFTSLSVTRRINWNIDYPGQSPAPDADKVVTELTVVQKDIQAIIPIAMDTEIINTAILTGRTVAIPVKMVSIELNGGVNDISAFVQCKSTNEDIMKVSMNCDYVFVNGKETRGSMNARVIFSYEHLSAPLELTVWVPKLPLQVELSDYNLSFIKGWRVPILPDRRSARDSDVDEDDDERRLSRGCTLQFQRALVKLDVTELVQDSLKVGDPRVAELVDRTVLVGLELGVTTIKVESPLAVDAVLGEASFSVTDDKVSITELRVHAVSGLAMSVQPSPGNSHTMVVKAEASLSIWMLFSDSTAATLTFFDPKDYTLNSSSLDEKVVSVVQEPGQRWPAVAAEGEGSGELVRVEMTICEACQKTKRKSVIASANVFVKVRFGSEEDSEEETTTEGEMEMIPFTRRPTSNEQPASVPIDYTNFPTISIPERPTDSDLEEDEFIHSPRNMTDLEIGMYALLGVFCLAILVFLINCIVFVLKYRHKRIPPEGQANMDHSHHWVFLGNGQPLRAQCQLSPQQADAPMESVQTCCHGDQHSSGSSQASVQSQAHGRGDGSSGGSTKDNGEEASSPTSKRKRVKFTTFSTLPTEELPYNAIPMADEQDIQWVCQDMGFQDPEELHDYMRRIKEIA
uniref:Transmembrane protein 132E n=1 Tax=Neogobius melanostomus TaxID=47308 RepID=A0A8C6ULR2_9GOBI